MKFKSGKQDHTTRTSKIPRAEAHPKPTSLQDMSCSNSLASADDVLGEVGAQHSWMCASRLTYYYYIHSHSKQASSRKWQFTWKEAWQTDLQSTMALPNSGTAVSIFRASSSRSCFPRCQTIIQNSF